MAISYLTGIPKSGKTYLAVYEIYKNFIEVPKPSLFDKFFKKPKKADKYAICWTNINEFDYSKSEKIKALDVNDFKYNLSLLYDLYVGGANDTELNEKAADFKLNHCLIVIDEAHNFFTKKGDEILTWWLTYHAHLFQDIWLITQDLSLIDTGYKAVAEYFYKAVEPARRLIASRFRYQQFISYRMNQSDMIKGGGFTLPALSEVFKLYVAGSKQKGSSVVVKFLGLAMVLCLFSLFAFYRFYSLFKSDEASASTDTQAQADTRQEVKSADNKALSSTSNANSNEPPIGYIYQIHCFYDRCSIQNGTYDHFDQRYLNFIFLRSPPKFSVRSFKGKGITYFFVGFDKPVFDNLKKEELNEKGSFSSAIYSK
nr:zonular occludens toxin domain-containing protein [uncultured Campylobacter sp.]